MEKLELLIDTSSVKVKEIILPAGDEGKWHFHSYLLENVYCLDGQISVYLKQPDGKITLNPGERCMTHAGHVHKICNESSKSSKHLLVQGQGEYDFIEVEV